ncbi:MAG: D-alanine--D-alanine ligase [Clostridiales bacterium]|jgi:D-alanine-D-alanine ligase|nr:D-alanine--D-alanine ligase [Clostridiales bacterium]
MSKLNVAVIFGGVSPEHEVSLASASTIISNLSEDKYNIIPVYITKEGKWLMYEGILKSDLNSILWEKFGVEAILSPDRETGGLLRIVGGKMRTVFVDVIFPVLHGSYGEDGTIQGLFEISGIPYVGCGVLSSALAMDKEITKVIAKEIGLNQADYLSYKKYELEDLTEPLKKIRTKIGYPCFVKPANAGSSVGVSKAKNKKELESAIKLALQHDNKIVVEKAIDGREFECAILGSGNEDTIASTVGEILANADFYDYDAKYNSTESQTIIPADIDIKASGEIKEAALNIFKALGCSGLSRVDFFIEGLSKKVVFNEINTIPGFTSISMYPMLFEYDGIKTPELLNRLINIALKK